MVLVALYLRIKWPTHEAGHSPPSSAMVKNEWSYTLTLHYAFKGHTWTTFLPYIKKNQVNMSKIQSVPLATKPGISLIILILSAHKWWPLSAHVTMTSHFLHNEVSTPQISLQYPH